jgi:prepilin-type processing-associated H-X9-DG protein/prepilin-type N-terminal cleavage/methylation domain-containing protein
VKNFTLFPSSFLSSSRHASGFSLIELLTTVGIIVVLAALIVPTLQGSIASSRQSTCVANLRQLASGCILYAQDHDGALPFAEGDGKWHRLIYPYLNTKNADTQIWEKEQWKESIQKEKYYICPSDQTPYDDTLSYAWNKNLKSSQGTPYRVQNGRSHIMLAEGESYSFNLSEKTGLEFRHREKGNFAYTDGHVDTFTKNEPMEDRIKVEY